MLGEIIGLALLLSVIGGLFWISRSSSRLHTAVYMAALPCSVVIPAILFGPHARLPLGIAVTPVLLISVSFIWLILKIFGTIFGARR